jgi:hypothetical protein
MPRRGLHEFRQEFFSLRVVSSWNQLPDAVKAASTAAAFKKAYRQHIESRVVRTTDGGQI